ncbi:hypothetical protein ACH49G_06650 [Streptomyces chrestomyceticus]|uniref:hypothetical protein n=1 Tax=Streptomyces chrestomyceticus TaxID=68185 RepID=UPI0037AFABA0
MVAGGRTIDALPAEELVLPLVATPARRTCSTTTATRSNSSPTCTPCRPPAPTSSSASARPATAPRSRPASWHCPVGASARPAVPAPSGAPARLAPVSVAGQVCAGGVGPEVTGGLLLDIADRGGADRDGSAEGPFGVVDEQQGGGEQGGGHGQGGELGPVVAAGDAQAQGDDGDGEQDEHEPVDRRGDRRGRLRQPRLAGLGPGVVRRHEHAEGALVRADVLEGAAQVGGPDAGLRGTLAVGHGRPFVVAYRAGVADDVGLYPVALRGVGEVVRCLRQVVGRVGLVVGGFLGPVVGAGGGGQDEGENQYGEGLHRAEQVFHRQTCVVGVGVVTAQEVVGDQAEDQGDHGHHDGDGHVSGSPGAGSGLDDAAVSYPTAFA